MPRWTLYSAPGTCALATHIALREAGSDAEVVHLNFIAQEQQGTPYLAINPQGRVPSLVTPEGVLTETPALLMFVAQRFAAAQLAPLDDPFALARMQAFLSWMASTVHVAHAHRRRGARWADDVAAQASMRAKVASNMAAHAAVIEAGLTSPWVMGERYSVADGYLFTIGRWLEGDGVDTSVYPRLLAHRARVAARPAVQRVLAELPVDTRR